MNVLAAAIFITCLPAGLLDFAMPRWKAEKDIRIEDAYKWIFQATRGGEHAAVDQKAAKEWMDREWAAVGPIDSPEPEWTPLCPNSEVGRLSLRRFKARGGGSDALLQAFLASAAAFRPDQKLFTDAWIELGVRLKKEPVNKLTHTEWARLDAAMKKKGYGAVRHSEDYNKARKPAYRVLTQDQALRLLSQ